MLPSASDAEIKAAYRRLALKLHPDVNDAPDATERFAALANAYGGWLACVGLRLCSCPAWEDGDAYRQRCGAQQRRGGVNFAWRLASTVGGVELGLIAAGVVRPANADTLSDATSRRLYDQFGPEGMKRQPGERLGSSSEEDMQHSSPPCQLQPLPADWHVCAELRCAALR